ncbi:MAG: GTA-gp10 family protein [Brevundimonas sp.]|uniref:GTA-gp10 family protein n=1 Tax=Brevundimonas sp. TaxID=1871086 RepID=UPI00391AD211
MVANGARGEVVARLAGAERRLCLTLGALAEMETALECEGLAALAERMRALSTSDLTVVLAALLRGGGEGALADRLAVAPVDPREAAEAVARAFAAAA